MTPEEMAKEIEWIKNENVNHMKIILESKDKKEKSEHRKILLENKHQLMHLESVLASIKYDPLF